MKRMHTIRFVGKTKDGTYAAEKEIHVSKFSDTTFTVPKVITENGYQNVTIKLNRKGQLLAVMLERWDPTIV